MRNLEGFLNFLARLQQQVLYVQDDSGFAGDGVDGLQLRSAPAFQRVQVSILQSHRGLGRKQSQQINRFVIEVIRIFALTIQHTHYFIADHQWNCQLRTGLLSPREITGVFCKIGHIQGAFVLGGNSDQASPNRHSNLIKTLSADLGAHAQMLFVLIQQ